MKFVFDHPLEEGFAYEAMPKQPVLHPWPERQDLAIPMAIIRALGVPKNRAVVDPFCGSGTTGIAAKRLGVHAYLGDINPLAKVFAEAGMGFNGSWDGEFLPEKVEDVGREVRKVAAFKLREIAGAENVSGWLWVRTVKSPSPEYAAVDVPLIRDFALDGRHGAWLEPVVGRDGWRFEVRTGEIPEVVRKGLQYRKGGDFRCIMSGLPIERSYIEREISEGRGGFRLVAVLEDLPDGTRRFRVPDEDDVRRARRVKVAFRPSTPIGAGKVRERFAPYGMVEWADFFLPRQIIVLETIIDSILDTVGLSNEIVAALMIALGKLANRSSVLCSWNSARVCQNQSITHDALKMAWSFFEMNPLRESGGWMQCVGEVAATLKELCGQARSKVKFRLGDVMEQDLPKAKSIFVTELPMPGTGYPDDVNDFFYVWMREGLRRLWQGEFETLATPKAGRIETHEQLVLALRRLKSEQDRKFPAVFSFRYLPGRTREMLVDILKADWTVSALWLAGESVVVVARALPHGTETISRQEFRELVRAELAALPGDALADSPESTVLPALGRGLRALVGVKSVLRADGTECPAELVCEDAMEVAANHYHLT